MMKFTQLKQHLASGELFAAYMPIGEDRYLMTHAKKLLTDLVELPELNVNTFNGASNPSDVVWACNMMPMMSKYRLVVYEGFKTLEKPLLDYLAAPNRDTILVLLPSSAYKGVPDKTEKVDCDHLDERTLTAWIKKESGDRCEPSAIQALIDYTASDLTRISTELAKLLDYAHERKVTADDVSNMVVRDIQYKMYELTGAVSEGKTDLAYDMTERILREIDALGVIKSLSSLFHRMLHVRISRAADSEICASLGIKQGALWHLRQQSKRFSPVRLKALYDYILDSEYRVKTGGLTSDAALDNIMLKVFAAV